MDPSIVTFVRRQASNAFRKPWRCGGLATWVLLASLASAQTPGSGPLPRHERSVVKNQQGIEAYEAGRYAEAVDLFEEARRLSPKEETVLRNLARALHGRARGLLTEGRTSDALADLRRALELDGTEPAFLVLLSEVHEKREELDLARRTLQNGLEQHPSCADLFERLGRLEYREENLSESVTCLETAIRLDKDRKDRLATLLAKIRREKEIEGGFFRDTRGRFTVKYDDKEFRYVGVQVLDLLERTYTTLSTNFRFRPERRLTVVLYARDEFRQATGAHGWAGGLFDGKIRVPVKNWRLASEEIESTIRHELTHWFVDNMTRRCPLWLNEGLAQLQEGKKTGAVTRRLIADAVTAKTYERFQDLPKSWTGIADSDRVRLYYAQSLHFTEFLERRYGLDALGRVIRSEEAFPAAFQTILGLTLKDVEDDWLRTLP